MCACTLTPTSRHENLSSTLFIYLTPAELVTVRSFNHPLLGLVLSEHT